MIRKQSQPFVSIYPLINLLSPARASVFADLRFGFTDFADGDLTISEGRDIVSAADLLVAEEHLSDDSHVILIEGHDCNFMSVAGRLWGFWVGSIG
ncbi:hypothetical protein ACFX13_018772 [Malus domestica]